MDEDKDLPLVSNVNDILVEHYVFTLKCHFDRKVFEGSVILRLKPVTEKCEKCTKRRDESVSETIQKCNTEDYVRTDDEERCIICTVCNCVECTCSTESTSLFKCILDCQDISVYEVTEVGNPQVPFSYPEEPSELNNSLKFEVDNWSLRMWKEGVYCAHHFPPLVRISYCTQQKGLSLLWVKTQDGRDCVYTYGAWINNRSLFPCQEPPTAMATWEARVTVDRESVVLMSGDEIPVITRETDGLVTYYYYTKMVLPMSTLALAVGCWKEYTVLDVNPHCRIFAPEVLFDKAVEQFSGYLPRCLNSAEHYLGRYPFQRIDVLFVPRGFGSLGMASPNVIFLSQSLLSSDKSTCARLAHEIAHGWFGLLIGALDWTEEWLSEGFSTFMEDILHTHAMEMTQEEEDEYSEVKFVLRLRTLQSELQHTDEELQILRPNQGEIPKEEKNGITVVYIKNGQNVQKGFLQVHYLKGYFLLTFLCKLVGKKSFIQLLNNYIETYKGQLVESKEIFNLYFDTFPLSSNKIDMETIYTKWLNCSSLPKEILNFKPSSSNRLYNNSIAEFKKWMAVNRLFTRPKPRKRRKVSWESFSELQSEQLLILLEKILDKDKVSLQTLRALERVYVLGERNADIRHRWCELIVKHHLSSCYPQVENFLREDLAMGIYLYGELLSSELAVEENLAKKCFRELFDEMEPNFRVTIRNMIEES